jgi:hypothetical protein
MHSGMYGMYALQESVRQMRGTATAQIADAKISVSVGGMFAASRLPVAQALRVHGFPRRRLRTPQYLLGPEQGRPSFALSWFGLRRSLAQSLTYKSLRNISVVLVTPAHEFGSAAGECPLVVLAKAGTHAIVESEFPSNGATLPEWQGSCRGGPDPGSCQG